MVICSFRSPLLPPLSYSLCWHSLPAPLLYPTLCDLTSGLEDNDVIDAMSGAIALSLPTLISVPGTICGLAGPDPEASGNLLHSREYLFHRRENRFQSRENPFHNRENRFQPFSNLRQKLQISWMMDWKFVECFQVFLSHLLIIETYKFTLHNLLLLCSHYILLLSGVILIYFF